MNETDKNSTQQLFSQHRKRLRQRFIELNGKGMFDYELLELLLTFAIPRKDVKPLAKMLIKKFGSLQEVISTDFSSLKEIGGVGDVAATIIALSGVIGYAKFKNKIKKRSIIKEWATLVEYCISAFGYKKRECFAIILLDNANQIIYDGIQTEGNVEQIHIYPRNIIKLCLNFEATSIVLIHNHPSGLIEPSYDDIDATQKLNDMCKKINIRLFDHLIIAKNKYYSMKENGLI